MPKLAPLLLVMILLSGCSTQRYRYAPIGGEGVVAVDGIKGATYDIPSTAHSKGEVHVLSYGVAYFIARKDEPGIRVLNLRMIVDNQEKASWLLNTREQTLSLPQEGSSLPAYVNTDSAGNELPRIPIRPGETKVVDLYFPLPKRMDEISEIPSFEFHWEIQTADMKVRDTTPFARYRVGPSVAAVSPGDWASPTGEYTLGWGPTWWYDRDFAHWTWSDPVTAFPFT